MTAREQVVRAVYRAFESGDRGVVEHNLTDDFVFSAPPDVLGFRAAKRHLSILPFSPVAIEAVKDRLDGFDLAKGTIRFSPDRPVPEDVLADVVRARKQEITASR